jgi:hypothetical protein
MPCAYWGAREAIAWPDASPAVLSFPNMFECASQYCFGGPCYQFWPS